VEANHSEIVRFIGVDEKAIQDRKGPVRIVELRGSDHYVFRASQEEVLRDVRAFLLGSG
jgi:hypothetical protein